jgi:hypothetical protein
MDNQETTTKKKKKKKPRETPLIQYPNPIPNIKELHSDYIKDYMNDKATKEDKEWFKKLFNQPLKKDKNNKDRGIDFMEIKSEFAKRFMPELVSSKPKKQSLKDFANSL